MTPLAAVPFPLEAAPLAKYMGDTLATLRVERLAITLEMRSPGRLVPWLGPAIRGITALRHRAAVCEQPREEWTGRWKHCRGCPHAARCGYGLAFEPEAVADHSDAVRRLVIAPAFPAPLASRRGETLAVQVTSLGAEVSRAVPGIVAALRAAGQRDGLGPDRVRFAVAEAATQASAIAVDPGRLPDLAAASPALPRLTITLDGPLFLRERESRTRRPILDPDFCILLRHAVRIIGEFFPSVAAELPEPVRQAAAAVPIVERSIAPFRQEKASRRTFQRFEMEGIVGSLTFADVPARFLPWLVLGGILHVGGHRVAGAGGWTVQADPPPRPPTQQ